MGAKLKLDILMVLTGIFQMVFCATTVSIVSGTLAERIKLWPFFLFAALLSGIIYPIVMGWQWEVAA